MLDTRQMIPVIKSDQAGRPRVELRGDGLYGACVSECMFAPSFCYVNQVHCFNLWWEFLLFPSALLARLVLVLAWCILPLVLGVELAGLFEDPTFSMGMICRFIRGAMDLTYLVQNFV